MNFQIDIIPVFVGQHMKEHMRMKTYINDFVYESTIHADQVKHMLKTGAIDKVQNPDANGVDSAGVMFTSKTYQLIDVQLKKAS